ncbi:MAG: serine/threonine-protein kinase [Rickettsiaceae bacterium]|jgi:hypothetical protein|nr:serine/threonine-protein kinase [Rickettsiaceae bacterium]
MSRDKGKEKETISLQSAPHLPTYTKEDTGKAEAQIVDIYTPASNESESNRTIKRKPAQLNLMGDNPVLPSVAELNTTYTPFINNGAHRRQQSLQNKTDDSVSSYSALSAPQLSPAKNGYSRPSTPQPASTKASPRTQDSIEKVFKNAWATVSSAVIQIASPRNNTSPKGSPKISTAEIPVIPTEKQKLIRKPTKSKHMSKFMDTHGRFPTEEELAQQYVIELAKAIHNYRFAVSYSEPERTAEEYITQLIDLGATPAKGYEHFSEFSSNAIAQREQSGKVAGQTPCKTQILSLSVLDINDKTKNLLDGLSNGTVKSFKDASLIPAEGIIMASFINALATESITSKNADGSDKKVTRGNFKSTFATQLANKTDNFKDKEKAEKLYEVINKIAGGSQDTPSGMLTAVLCTCTQESLGEDSILKTIATNYPAWRTAGEFFNSITTHNKQEDGIARYKRQLAEREKIKQEFINEIDSNNFDMNSNEFKNKVLAWDSRLLNLLEEEILSLQDTEKNRGKSGWKIAGAVLPDALTQVQNKKSANQVLINGTTSITASSSSIPAPKEPDKHKLNKLSLAPLTVKAVNLDDSIDLGKKLLNLLSFGQTERDKNGDIFTGKEADKVNSVKSILQQATELIEAGADLSLKDKRGRTALHKAAHHGYTQITDLLLQYGANTQTTDKHRHTPLDDAKRGICFVDSLVYDLDKKNFSTRKELTQNHADHQKIARIIEDRPSPIRNLKADFDKVADNHRHSR